MGTESNLVPSQPGGIPAVPNAISSLAIQSRSAVSKSQSEPYLAPSEPSPCIDKPTIPRQRSPSRYSDAINSEHTSNGGLQMRSRNACIHCTERSIECSGYPGPCSFCSSMKPVALQCTFPLKRHKSDSQIPFTCRYVSNGVCNDAGESVTTEAGGDGDIVDDDNDKRSGLTSHINANGPVTMIPNSTELKFNMDVLIHMTIGQVIDDLKVNHFLRPSIATPSSFRNQGYYRHWITVAVKTWITTMGPLKSDVEFNDFARLFSSLQDSGDPETAWSLDILVLKKLFWLSGSGFSIHDRTKKHPPRMVLAEFCLLLMWMGPADMSGVVAASDAICTIYNWLTASKDRVCVFQGLCSRQSAISTLRFSSFSCVYHLNEGRMECGREFPADYRMEFFCRNLVCTSAVNSSGLLGSDRCPCAFRHDLMLDISKSDLAVPSVTPCPKQ